jgi:hypothetical protein
MILDMGLLEGLTKTFLCGRNIFVFVICSSYMTMIIIETFLNVSGVFFQIFLLPY